MSDAHAELEVAQRYAARQLNAIEAASFEDHMVGCERCQAEVLLASGLRRVMREAPSALPRTRGRRIAVGSALLAAVITAIIVMPDRVNRELAALGQVGEPPAYIGVSVRSAAQRGDSLFAAAMQSYSARRYDKAAIGLRAALDAGADTVRATFFLGASQFMTGRAREAAESFARVIATGPMATGYLAEAHLFRARALLKLGEPAEALTELSAVGAADRERRQEADSLSARIVEVMRR